MNHPVTQHDLDTAFSRCQADLLRARTPAGHWVGRLSSSVLSTATTISAFSFYRQLGEPDDRLLGRINRVIDGGINWVLTQQNGDGGWGDTPKSLSNISTTMLVDAAFHAAGVARQYSDVLDRAQVYVDAQGGIPGLRERYGIDRTFAVPILANCAMAGVVCWKEVAALPFEAAVVPQRFYNLLQLPVVSYAIPALVAIGQAKFANDPPWDPIRKFIRRSSINRSLQVLERMQPSTGGFLEAAPLTGFVCMGLIHAGQSEHPVVKNGIEFLLESVRVEPTQSRESESISLPIDTNLATWLTTLSINALTENPGGFADDRAGMSRCLDWLLRCQNQTVHPFTGAAPGGWGWSDLSGAVPDADDTPGALIALWRLRNQAALDDWDLEVIDDAARAGIHWLLKLQNRDRGWPTFCKGWGKLPFDRSGVDITAHVLRALLAWQSVFAGSKIECAVRSGFDFLRKNQQNDGSWFALWFGNQDHNREENPFYGTAKVLMAYRDANLFDTREVQFGLHWLHENQNPDGGWGGGSSLATINERDPSLELGISSVEETALCTEVLLEDESVDGHTAAQRGVDWLIRAVHGGCHHHSSPIGFYFAKLWYYEDLYPLIFTTSALARAMALQHTELASPAD